MILVIAEQRGGRLNPVTWETIAAGQALDEPLTVVVAGARVESVAEELAAADVAEVLVVEDPALEPYTPDGFVAALAHVVAQVQPSLVLFPHTYQTRDYAPALAARLERTLMTDCIGTKSRDGGVAFVRPMFQGKFVADVAPEGPPPHFASCQIGAYRADTAVRGTSPVATRTIPVTIDSASIRQRPEEPFKEAKQAVDLTQAERIVAVGRGIKGQEHLPLAQELAKALGAELAASRPICDSGWLPMDILDNKMLNWGCRGCCCSSCW